MITFPHIGNIDIFIRVLLDYFLVDYIVPPHSSKKTLELGVKNTPEMVCFPLKVNLGNFIESIEKGADTVVITGGCGPCRFGYYGQMHKEILESIGYDVNVITIDTVNGFKDLMKRLKAVFCTYDIFCIIDAFLRAYRVMKKVDELDSLSFKLRARELVPDTTDKIMRNFRKEIDSAKGTRSIKKIIRQTKEQLQKVQIDEEAKPLKIGLVGDLYTVIEPFSNIRIEQLLGKMRIELHKSLTISKWIREHFLMRGIKTRHKRKFDKVVSPYLDIPIGGHARESIGNSALYAKESIDGIIQIYPLTCMPEIVASSILPSVSEDYDIPIMTLILDEMTGEAGYKTRIDAFADLLYKRRERKDYEQCILSGN